MPKQVSDLGGVLPLVKPAGPTSHDVVQVARRVLNQRQIGHTGTLDPAATGLLLLCLGPYTKIVPYLTESSKTYEGYIGLGIETTTDDGEGAPTLISDDCAVSEERLRAFVGKFVGDIEQVPPRYAAVKVAGKKLYEYARENIEIIVEPRPVTVYSFTLGAIETVQASPALLARAATSPDTPARTSHTILRVPFTARVSAGTYVRSLARDLGRELGCGGFLMGLSRTAIGKFQIENAMPYEVMTESPERVHDYLVRGAAALDSERFPIIRIYRAYQERLFRGQPLHEKMMLDVEEAEKLTSGTVAGIAAEDGGALLAMVQAERFDSQVRENPYGTRFAVHLKPLRIFPGGLH